jgi:hypothetical protein
MQFKTLLDGCQALWLRRRYLIPTRDVSLQSERPHVQRGGVLRVPVAGRRLSTFCQNG